MHNGLKIVAIAICLSFLLVFSIKAQNQQKADSILSIIEKNNLLPREKMEAYYLIATASSSPLDELKYAEILLDLANRTGDVEYLIKANLRIGTARRLQGDLAESLIYLFESANQALTRDDFQHLLANIYSEISTCYTQNEDSENALLYGKKTLDILKKTNRTQEYAIGLLNLGYDYYTIGEYDSAISYYNISHPIFQSIGMPIGEAYILGNRALVYWKTGKLNIAKSDLLKAIEKLKPLGDNYGMADYYNQLATIFWEENKPEETILYATKGLELAQQEGMKEQIRDASYLLFSAYEDAAQYDKAIMYQSLYFEKKDSIQNLESTLELANLRTLFEVGRKQSEVDLLLEQRKNSQLIMLAGAVAIVIMIVLLGIIYFYSKTKIKLNKELEDRKDKLLELNSTKDKFFSVISHDLRGPVGIIDGYVSVFRRKFDDISTEELKTMLDQMSQSTESLVRLLDNLLTWALQQQGQFSHIPEKVKVNGVLSECLDLFQATARVKNITQKLIAETDFEVLADKNSISTIVRNLINNALKFTNEGGQIIVTAEKDENIQKGVIKVIDNGVGMKESKVKNLFKLNENLSTRGTLGESGLGLGLQLVKEFVHLNDGDIQVSSVLGKGTTFEIHLPLA